MDICVTGDNTLYFKLKGVCCTLSNKEIARKNEGKTLLNYHTRKLLEINSNIDRG